MCDDDDDDNENDDNGDDDDDGDVSICCEICLIRRRRLQFCDHKLCQVRLFMRRGNPFVRWVDWDGMGSVSSIGVVLLVLVDRVEKMVRDVTVCVHVTKVD